MRRGWGRLRILDPDNSHAHPFRRSRMRRLLASTLIVVPLLLGGCGSDPVDVEGNWMLVGARLPEGHWDPEDPEQTRYFLQIAEATDEAGEDVGLVAKGFA